MVQLTRLKPLAFVVSTYLGGMATVALLIYILDGLMPSVFDIGRRKVPEDPAKICAVIEGLIRSELEWLEAPPGEAWVANLCQPSEVARNTIFTYRVDSRYRAEGGTVSYSALVQFDPDEGSWSLLCFRNREVGLCWN